MVKPLISIIMPTYNTLNYIKTGIKSVLNQTYDNIELIIVNDGSTDGTKEFLDEISSKYSQIVVIHQQNAGVSTARNKALDNSKGEYVSFLDSDDWLEEDAIECLYEQIKNRENTLSACNRRNVKIRNGEILFKKEGQIRPSIFVPQDKALLETGSGVFHLQSACHKLFPSSLIQKNKIRFHKDISHGEDGLFVFNALRFSKGLVFTNVAKWNVVSRLGSASKSDFTIERLTALKAISTMINITNSNELLKHLKTYYTKRTMTQILLYSISGIKQKHIQKKLYYSLRKYEKVFLESEQSWKIKLKYYLCLYTPINIISYIYKMNNILKDWYENKFLYR